MSRRVHPSGARLVHIIEQVEAGQRHAEAIAFAEAEHCVSVEDGGPVVAELLYRMSNKLAAAHEVGAAACPHLVVGRAEPAWWLARRPDLLLCLECQPAFVRNFYDGPKRQRCDHCGRVTRRLERVTVLIDAQILTAADEREYAVPATFVFMHLCRNCRHADQADSAPG